MTRLSLCCLFKDFPIKYRTTTARYLRVLQNKNEDPFAYVAAIISDNIESLKQTIAFCAKHKIGSFRVNSAFFPVCTHPDFLYTIHDLPGAENLLQELEEIKKESKKQEIRLTFHPDQFVVLNSPKEEVVAHSLAELEYHGVLAELIGADVINIHGGGGYGDKKSALKRFAENFAKLSSRVKSRLTVENDDRTYTPEELLPLCKELGIPLVYDAHHHRCLPDQLTVEKASERALETWDREPLFHISSPLLGWDSKKPQLHHDYIDINDVPSCWKRISLLTIDVEAKAKELAVIRLKRDLSNKGWDIGCTV